MGERKPLSETLSRKELLDYIDTLIALKDAKERKVEQLTEMIERLQWDVSALHGYQSCRWCGWFDDFKKPHDCELEKVLKEGE